MTFDRAAAERIVADPPRPERGRMCAGDVADDADGCIDEVVGVLRTAVAEIDRLTGLINTPHTDDFFEAVRLEAAHQVERWSADHDDGKADADWFWLVGYIAGKALRGDAKQLHHIVTTAAALLNWHRHKTGESIAMRSGIADPEVAP